MTPSQELSTHDHSTHDHSKHAKTMTHEDSIAANIAQFNEEFAQTYEQLDSQRTLSLLFTKYILEYDFANPTKRKSAEETKIPIGDPNLETNGLTVQNTLPDPTTYLSNFPNTVFKPGMKLLDFACGPGLVTQLFAPYLIGQTPSEIVGMDISPVFLQHFDQRVEKLKNDKLDFNSYQYDIISQDPQIQQQLKQFENKFDAIICTISYHHIDNYQMVTKKLATFLKPGGWLFIVDFYNEDVEDPNANPNNPSVAHMGGLKIDALNHTLGDIAGLINVSSACEFRTPLWQIEDFIRNHLNEKTVKKMEKGELPEKSILGRKTGYLVECSIIYAVGQKKPLV
ncbi:uncharacterized protein J8A68_001743 [[Candida] subhashii]|uniref:Methyltransferase domain-containing protein n=1 Tax=[Candida] subhashii TaxID=561895 RepID=A0A8J5QQQ1_9ASCO|nr:uncharacterized protein J8A68_001743 [[Candida] subhashii]KAG7664718.1 hypothetical protein J8A68_001743 [[Candida] subhashii]